MPPAERGVSVDDDVFRAAGKFENILEHTPPQQMQPRQGQIQDASGGHIRRFGIHPSADVTHLNGSAVAAGQIHDIFQISAFIKSDGSRYNNFHGGILADYRAIFQSKRPINILL